MAGAFGRQLKKALRDRDMTQNALAVYARVDQSTISKLLTGKRTNPGLDLVVVLAKALHVSIDWLATGEMWQQDALTPEEAAHIANLRAIREPAIVELILGMARDAARKGR